MPRFVYGVLRGATVERAQSRKAVIGAQTRLPAVGADKSTASLNAIPAVDAGCGPAVLPQRLYRPVASSGSGGYCPACKTERIDSGIVAIGLEFIDVVVPITRIRESYPGGWDQCCRDYAGLIGRRVWYDEHLFRDGAMDPSQARMLVEGWAVLGFEPTEKRPEGLYWKDICVIDWRQGGPTAPCDWLAFDRNSRTAHLAGTEPGPLVWRGRPRLNGAP